VSPRDRIALTTVLRHVASVVADALVKLEEEDEPKAPTEDRLLSAKEASRRTGMSTRWLYLHADELPFAVRTSGRAVRFSERGMDRWKKLKAERS